MDFNIGDQVTVLAPATLFGAEISAFGAENAQGEVTYVHPYVSICYVVTPVGEGYVDITSLEIAA